MAKQYMYGEERPHLKENVMESISNSNTYEGWTNQRTWYVNLRIKNNPTAYRMMLALKPFTPESARHFVTNLRKNDVNGRFGEKLFIPNLEIDEVNFNELVEDWNQEDS